MFYFLMLEMCETNLHDYMECKTVNPKHTVVPQCILQTDFNRSNTIVCAIHNLLEEVSEGQSRILMCIEMLYMDSSHICASNFCKLGLQIVSFVRALALYY